MKNQKSSIKQTKSQEKSSAKTSTTGEVSETCLFCGGYECTDANPICKWRKEVVAMPGNFTEDTLHKALLHVEDLLGRILTPFILLGDTAKGVKKESLVGLTKIQVGVMEKELIESNLRTLETLIGDIRTDYGFGYVVGGVPVEIHIIKKSVPVFENPDHAFYRAGEYAIPNPFSEYEKARWLI